MAKSRAFDGNVVTTTVTTSETTIAHGLARTPVEAFVLTRTGSGNVFRGATAWNATNIFLTASAAVNVRLLII